MEKVCCVKQPFRRKILGIRAKGNNSSRPKSVSFHSLLHTNLIYNYQVFGVLKHKEGSGSVVECLTLD